MHFMAFLRKRFAQFGGHHATSPERWVANDTYFNLIHG
jgi:hypothetical protein